MPVIDFREITASSSPEGYDVFELFAREFLELSGYKIHRAPDRGPDGGRDLIVDEVRKGVGGKTRIRWLVSCKHKAHSKRSVTVKDESDIGDRVDQHLCSGFMAFYSTLPSCGLANKLSALESKSSFEVKIFDRESIERTLLSKASLKALARRFFPNSFCRWEARQPPGTRQRSPDHSSTQKMFTEAEQVRQSDLLYRLIHGIYSKYKPVTSGSDLYPISFLRVPDNQSDPESILGQLHDRRELQAEKSVESKGIEYLNYLKVLNKELENRDTYCVDEIRYERNGFMKIDCSVGEYFENIKCLAVLEWELLNAVKRWGKETGDAHSFLEKRLPLRHFFHSRGDVCSLITKPRGRQVSLGISTMVIFRREKDYATFIGERSDKVAVHGGLYHVVPSLAFQPVVNEYEREFSVSHNVYREYLEELFDLQEVRNPPSVISHDYFYDNPNLVYLKKLMKAGKGQLFLTGVSIDFLTTRPEICTLLFIESPEWYLSHKTGKGNLKRIQFNEEWKTPDNRRRPNVISVDNIDKIGLSPKNTAPPGAAAIRLGLKKFHRLVKRGTKRHRGTT